VILGDVIDYGPDSRDVVHQLLDVSRRCRFYAEAHHNLGTALRDQGKLDKAVAEFGTYPPPASRAL
jgi:hypothetical protein